MVDLPDEVTPYKIMPRELEPGPSSKNFYTKHFIMP
jgi:hypothetical protein